MFHVNAARVCCVGHAAGENVQKVCEAAQEPAQDTSQVRRMQSAGGVWRIFSSKQRVCGTLVFSAVLVALCTIQILIS